MRKNKRGAMELSVGAIVALILAITFLSLGLIFIKGMLGKMFSKFEEQISEEPEPPKPTASQIITLSRNPIKSKEGNVETIKISMLNPSLEDWLNRQFIKTEGLCGKADGICYIDAGDTTNACDTKSNAKDNDPDCRNAGMFGLSCGKDSEEDHCLISNLEGDLYCPNFNEQSRDPDCNPKEGVGVYLTCDERIMEKPFRRDIGIIKKGEFKTNILLLRLKSRIPDGQYLCQLRVFAEDKEYMEDLVVRIENE